MKLLNYSLVLLLLIASRAPAQDLDSAALSAGIEKVRSERVDVLAPTFFADAIEAQQAAAKDAARGRNAERVRVRLQEAEMDLQRANAAAATARQLLSNPSPR